MGAVSELRGTLLSCSSFKGLFCSIWNWDTETKAESLSHAVLIFWGVTIYVFCLQPALPFHMAPLTFSRAPVWVIRKVCRVLIKPDAWLPCDHNQDCRIDRQSSGPRSDLVAEHSGDKWKPWYRWRFTQEFPYVPGEEYFQDTRPLSPFWGRLLGTSRDKSRSSLMSALCFSPKLTSLSKGKSMDSVSRKPAEREKKRKLRDNLVDCH